MHLIDNALEKLEYGCAPNGTMSLLLAEIVHAVQLGCHSRLHEGLIATQTCTKSKFNLENDQFRERINENWYDYTVVEVAESDSDSSSSSSESSSLDFGNTKTNDGLDSYEHPSRSFDSDDIPNNNALTDDKETDSVRSFLPPDDDELEEDSDGNHDNPCEDDDLNGGEKVNNNNGQVEPEVKKKRKTYVFGGVTGKRVDVISKIIGKQLQHQSDRDLPRTLFGKGIINKAKSTASEQQGMLLLFLIILCSRYGKTNLEKKIGPMRVANIIESIELFISFEEFCKDRRGFSPRIIPGFKKLMVDMKQMFRYVVDRREGKGMNLVKFHLLDHIPQDCLDMGSPVNTSGGPGEANQKQNKAAGKRTQMNQGSFNIQQSIKVAESNSIRTAGIHAGVRNNDAWAKATPVVIEHPQTSQNSEKDDVNICKGNHYSIFITAIGECSFQFTGYDYGTRGKSHSDNKKACLSAKYESVRRIIRKIRQHIDGFPLSTDIIIPVFTELRLPDENSAIQLFRADPIHRGSDGEIVERSDWAWFQWESGDSRKADEIVAGQLLCFLEANNSNKEFFEKEDSQIEMHAMFHSFSEMLPLSISMDDVFDINAMQHPASRLLFKGKIEREENTRLPKIYIDTVASIINPAIVIRDINPVWEKRNSKIAQHRSNKEEIELEYILVRKRRQWSDVFQRVCMNTYGEKKRFIPDFSLFFDEQNEKAEQV